MKFLAMSIQIFSSLKLSQADIALKDFEHMRAIIVPPEVAFMFVCLMAYKASIPHF